jgi:hypothetical protein
LLGGGGGAGGGGAASAGVAHHGRVGRRPVVVGRRVRVVERPHPRPAVVLVHHGDHEMNMTTPQKHSLR